MNINFDWSLVATFLAVLDRGSLLGAARQLGISQPTAGRHVAELEAQLGGALFERTGRGLRPTTLALTLAPAARTMKEGAMALTQSLQGMRETLGGTVRLTASQPVACYLLPTVLARLRAAQPAIQIELVVSNAVSNLLQREADIALRMVRPDQSSLVARRIAQVTLSACASRNYLDRRGTPATTDELLQHELIGLDHGDDLLRGFASLGYPATAEHFALRTDDLIATWQAVRAGLGIGFILNQVIDTDATVQRVLPELSLPVLPIWLTVHREIHGGGAIRAVYDFLAREIPRVLAPGDPDAPEPAAD